MTYPLPNLARTAKVNNPDGRSLRVAEEDVLGLEVTVDHVNVRGGQVEQCSTQLLGKLARQV